MLQQDQPLLKGVDMYMAAELSAIAEKEGRDDLRRLARRAQAVEDGASALALGVLTINSMVTQTLKSSEAALEGALDPGEKEKLRTEVDFRLAVRDMLRDAPKGPAA